MRVLFRVAAGPSTGFGHLVRCRSLARALGVLPSVSVRGSRETRKAAAERGFDVKLGGIALLREPTRPDVLVVDDPSAQQATRWVRRARHLRIPVATLHDLGLAYVESELSIDGSIEPGTTGAAVGLAGSFVPDLPRDLLFIVAKVLPSVGVFAPIGAGTAGLVGRIARGSGSLPTNAPVDRLAGDPPSLSAAAWSQARGTPDR